MLHGKLRDAVILFVGLAGGAMTSFGPAAYPAAPHWVWFALFILCACIFLFGLSLLVADLVADVFPSKGGGRRLFSRHNAPPLIGAFVFVCLGVGIAAAYLHNKSIGFPATSSPERAAPPGNRGKLVSTAFRRVFKCHSVLQEESQEEREKKFAYFPQVAKIIEELYGVIVNVIDDQGAVIIELSPRDPHSAMFGPMKKMVIEERRVDDHDVMAILRYEYGDNNLLFMILGLFPVPEDQKSRMQIREMVEHLLGVEPNGCQLI
jgi:hypothetical protein